MYVHINDLPFELLNNILDLLPLKELFHIERVCKKWQEVVKKLLDQKETLHPLDESLKRKYQTGLLGGMIFNDDYIDILKKILPKCQNIKELDLSYIKVNENNLIEIAKLCPKLKSISLLQTQFYVSEDEMNEFGKLIGPQLIKCKFNYFLVIISMLCLMHY